MALTPSRMLDLQSPLPAFELPDVVEGKSFSSEHWGPASAYLVMFICNHCPYVQHVLPELKKLEEDYAEQNVAFLAINSNDIIDYPQDGPEKMKALVKEEGWSFPFLLDESQKVAQSFKAACTPDFFVFDADKKLAYRGQLDGSRPENDKPLDGRDIRNALDALVAGKQPAPEQRPSVGCNIKWKAL